MVLEARYTLAYSLACEPFKIEFTDRDHGCMHLALAHYLVDRFLRAQIIRKMTVCHVDCWVLVHVCYL